MEFLRDYCFININLQIEYLENLESNLDVFNYTDSKILYSLKSMSIKSIINLKNVNKSFGNIIALENFTSDIFEGDFFS